MKTIFILCLVWILGSGCQSEKGTYLTINIQETDERYVEGLCYASEHFDELRQKLSGKRFSIDTKEDYAIMVDLAEKEEIILSKDEDEVGEFYSCEKSKRTGGETFKLQLRKDGSGKFVFVVKVVTATSSRQTQFIPVQIGGEVRTQACLARAVCYLSQID